MVSFLHDLRYALRGLAKAPSFTAVAILTLAFALGANTAIFSVVKAVLLQPLPFSQAEELVTFTGRSPRWTSQSFSWPNYVDIRKQSKTLEHVAAWTPASSFIYESGMEPERIRGAIATADLWPLLGVKPILGRTIMPADDRPGAAEVVMISQDVWQRRFGSDRSIVGRQIRLGVTPKTVVGVMPSGFKFPVEETKTDFWMAMAEDAAEQDGRGAIWMQLTGRVRDGVPLEQVNAELRTIAQRLEKQYPESNTGLTFMVSRFHAELVKSVRPALLVLMGAVGVVLLIGCANVANLLLVRAAVRHKEISIRSAIGATRARIVVQLLVESVLLAVIAGAAGLLLAAWGVDLLVALAPADIPLIDAVAIDRTVLVFTLGLSLLTGIVFGLAPAISASKTNLAESMKEGSRGSTEGRRRNRVRNGLVVAEIALSVFLLVGTGLLLRSFLKLSGVDPGFDYRNAIVLDVSARSSVFPDTPNLVQYQQLALQQLRSIPGVTAVGAANHLPFGSGETVYSFSIEGRPPFPEGYEPNARFVIVSEGYFDTMRIPVLRGRPITADDKAGGQRVVVISESFARVFFPNENPIGKRINITDGDGARTVVGVARDVRFASLSESPSHMFYVALPQTTSRRMQFVVRSPQAEKLGPTVRAAIRKVDPEQPILTVRTLEAMRDESLAGRKFILVLTGVLAVLALVLAAVGIYSIMSYSVTQRTSEIGIRMALGAEERDILRLVLGHALKMVTIGLALGVAVALGATRLMTSLLYGVDPADPATFAAICGLIGTIALSASFLPARRATRVDPLVAIRYD